MILALATSATTIDFSPVLTPLLQLAGLVLTGVAGWAVTKLATYLHVQSQSALLSTVVGVVDRGIAYGQQVVQAKIDTGVKVDVKNAVAAEAANYVIAKAPSTLKSLGMDASHVADLVLARLPPAPGAVAAPPPAAVPQPNP